MLKDVGLERARLGGRPNRADTKSRFDIEVIGCLHPLVIFANPISFHSLKIRQAHFVPFNLVGRSGTIGLRGPNQKIRIPFKLLRLERCEQMNGAAAVDRPRRIPVSSPDEIAEAGNLD